MDAKTTNQGNLARESDSIIEEDVHGEEIYVETLKDKAEHLEKSREYYIGENLKYQKALKEVREERDALLQAAQNVLKALDFLPMIIKASSEGKSIKLEGPSSRIINVLMGGLKMFNIKVPKSLSLIIVNMIGYVQKNQTKLKSKGPLIQQAIGKSQSVLANHQLINSSYQEAFQIIQKMVKNEQNN